MSAHLEAPFSVSPVVTCHVSTGIRTQVISKSNQTSALSPWAVSQAPIHHYISLGLKV